MHTTGLLHTTDGKTRLYRNEEEAWLVSTVGQGDTFRWSWQEQSLWGAGLRLDTQGREALVGLFYTLICTQTRRRLCLLSFTWPCPCQHSLRTSVTSRAIS